MLLANTTDKVQIVTTSVADIDIIVDYVDMDNTTKAVTPGRTLTKTNTAATTDILAAPASGVTRKVKYVSINNVHATTSNQVTVQYNANGTVYKTDTWPVAAAERIRFVEDQGFEVLDTVGRTKVPGLGLPVGNSNTADVVASAAATYMTGGNLLIGGRVQAGSWFEWTLRVTKTAAGTAAPTVAVATGTTASASDTARVTHTGVAQTAATDTGWLIVKATFRAVGASSVIESDIRMDHTSADAAGLGTLRYLSANSASFALGASDYIGLIVNPGTAGVWTFQHIDIAAYNLLS